MFATAASFRRPTSILNSLAHFHCAAVNTQTTNLLHNFLSERVKTHNLNKDTECASLNDHPLFYGSTKIPMKPDKLITLFFDLGQHCYREFRVYENSSMMELLRTLAFFDYDIDDPSTSVEMRRGLVHFDPFCGTEILLCGEDRSGS